MLPQVDGTGGTDTAPLTPAFLDDRKRRFGQGSTMSVDGRPMLGCGRVRPHERWAAQPLTGSRMSAVDYVLGDLRQAIDSGVIRVGERLPSEAALAARYSVSRTVIREVLRSSEALGLTVTRTGKGSFVVAKRPSQLMFDGFSSAHLMEARPHIEVPAAGLAAVRCTEQHVETLQNLIEAMDAETDDQVWVGLDASFHLAIAEASGNPVFASVLATIRAALASQSGMLNAAGRRGASNREHRSIAVAIARGSAVEAEDAMRFHLDQVKDAVTDSVHDDA
jgi:GntR family transcriptional regulator, transcriptional repressor for pyruvate dehydrogenase complex